MAVALCLSPSSSSSGTPSDSEVDEGPVEDDYVPQIVPLARPVGRPRKVPVFMQQPEFPPAGHDVVVALNDKVASLVRPVGGGLSNLIGYAVQKGPVPTALEDGGTEWLHHF